jgi:hypothetical protein
VEVEVVAVQEEQAAQVEEVMEVLEVLLQSQDQPILEVAEEETVLREQ